MDNDPRIDERRREVAEGKWSNGGNPMAGRPPQSGGQEEFQAPPGLDWFNQQNNAPVGGGGGFGGQSQGGGGFGGQFQGGGGFGGPSHGGGGFHRGQSQVGSGGPFGQQSQGGGGGPFGQQSSGRRGRGSQFKGSKTGVFSHPTGLSSKLGGPHVQVRGYDTGDPKLYHQNHGNLGPPATSTRPFVDNGPRGQGDRDRTQKKRGGSQVRP